MNSLTRPIKLSINRTWRILKWKAIKSLILLTGWPKLYHNTLNDTPYLGPFEKAKKRSLRVPKSSEGFSAEDGLHGTTACTEVCCEIENSLWIEIDGVGDCIRYYSHGLSKTRNNFVTIYFSGDVLLMKSNSVLCISSAYQDMTQEKIETEIEAWSREAGTPAIFLSRPGLYGSSGDHKERRKMREIELMKASVRKIKELHKIDSFILTGHSGGGLIVAALLNSRKDIYAAIMSSPIVSTKQLTAYWEYKNEIPRGLVLSSELLYDPIEKINNIPKVAASRIYVISDPEDQTVPFNTQLRYVRGLRSLGLEPQHIYAHASDPKHHDLSKHGKLTASLIARGATPYRIRHELHELDCEYISMKSTCYPHPSQSFKPPFIEAESMICITVPTNPNSRPKVLLQKSPAKRLPPASLTKIITTITALSIAEENNISEDYMIEIIEEDKITGSGLNLFPGDKITFKDAISNLLIPS